MGEIKAKLKVGDHVEALRGFDKAKITGEIVKIHEGENDFVDIELGNGTVEMVRAAESRLVDPPAPVDPPSPISQAEPVQEAAVPVQEAAKAAS